MPFARSSYAQTFAEASVTPAIWPQLVAAASITHNAWTIVRADKPTVSPRIPLVASWTRITGFSVVVYGRQTVTFSGPIVVPKAALLVGAPSVVVVTENLETVTEAPTPDLLAITSVLPKNAQSHGQVAAAVAVRDVSVASVCAVWRLVPSIVTSQRFIVDAVSQAMTKTFDPGTASTRVIPPIPAESRLSDDTTRPVALSTTV